MAANKQVSSLQHSDCGLQRVGRALTVWKSLELLTAIQVELPECGAVAHTCQSQVSTLKHSGSQLTAMDRAGFAKLMKYSLGGRDCKEVQLRQSNVWRAVQFPMPASGKSAF